MIFRLPKNKKALYKALSWRAISMAISLVLSYLFLGSWKSAGAYTLINAVIGTILYYYHELFYKWLRRKGKI